LKTTIFISFFVITAISISSCAKKQLGTILIPQNMPFEFIGKDGKSLITSLKDSVKVGYVENSITKFHSLIVMKLYASSANKGPDTTKLSVKYNGLVISDGAFMGDLSSRSQNPIRNYNIYLNGTNMGSLYIDYKGYLEVSSHSSSLLFNNTSVLTDTSNDYFFPNLPINLLQMQ